ncbi:MAG: stage II sporulation protein D [Turicibacter sp.]
MKKIGLLSLAFVLVLALIPIIFSVSYKTIEGNSDVVKPKPQSETAEVVEEKMVTVFRVESNVYEELPLEEYIMGVVSGEMPASYEIEALKAQAVAARTYALNTLKTEPAMYDSVKHQVYRDDTQLKEKWGADYELYKEKVRQAVLETEGQVIEYNGNLINPLYFSVSNGKTENAEDYWSEEIPYLRSVNSEWDKTANNYEVATEFELKTIRDKFKNQKLTKNDFKIISRTEGHNVEEILVGNKVYTGREVRELLGLRSSDFSFQFKDNIVVITTLGYGHGVGMSQYGANELAKTGKKYTDILNHYYQNININEIIS